VHSAPASGTTAEVASRAPEFGTPPLTREQFLEAPLVQLYGCVLSLSCHEGCTRLASYPIRRMAADHGGRQQLRRAISRLRCSGCRRRPATVSIFDQPDERAAPTWRAWLVP
jgi:hypothetical protein